MGKYIAVILVLSVSSSGLGKSHKLVKQKDIVTVNQASLSRDVLSQILSDESQVSNDGQSKNENMSTNKDPGEVGLKDLDENHPFLSVEPAFSVDKSSNGDTSDAKDNIDVSDSSQENVDRHETEESRSEIKDLRNQEDLIREMPFLIDSSGANSTADTLDFLLDPKSEPTQNNEERSRKHLGSKIHNSSGAKLGDKSRGSDFENRVDHAKELLGSRRFKSTKIAKTVRAKFFKKKLLADIRARLSEPNKKLAKKILKSILVESKKHQFDPVFVAAVIQTESSFNPLARGTSAELGLMQILPETAQWIAQKYNIPFRQSEALKNPRTNIRIGVAYMAFLRDFFKKNPSRYIAAYNMGAGNVMKLISQSHKPKEYSRRVLRNYRSIYDNLVL